MRPEDLGHTAVNPDPCAGVPVTAYLHTHFFSLEAVRGLRARQTRQQRCGHNGQHGSGGGSHGGAATRNGWRLCQIHALGCMTLERGARGHGVAGFSRDRAPGLQCSLQRLPGIWSVSCEDQVQAHLSTISSCRDRASRHNTLSYVGAGSARQGPRHADHLRCPRSVPVRWREWSGEHGVLCAGMTQRETRDDVFDHFAWRVIRPPACHRPPPSATA